MQDKNIELNQYDLSLFEAQECLLVRKKQETIWHSAHQVYQGNLLGPYHKLKKEGIETSQRHPQLR